MIITDAWLAKSGAPCLCGSRMVALPVLAAFVVMLLGAGLSHWFF